MHDEADLTIAPPGAPQVEPGAERPLLEDDVDELVDAPHVDEAIVRSLLRSLGAGASYALGDPDVVDHWRFTGRELDDLVPPLTRIINRRPALRRAVARGDEMAVAVVLAGYAGRNVADAQAAKEARERELEREAERAAPQGRGAGPGAPGSPAGPDGDRGPVPHAAGGGVA